MTLLENSTKIDPYQGSTDAMNANWNHPNWIEKFIACQKLNFSDWFERKIFSPLEIKVNTDHPRVSNKTYISGSIT